MTRFVSSRSWGKFRTSKGEVKAATRKPKDASEAIRWKKSKRKRVISRAKAMMRNSRP